MDRQTITKANAILSEIDTIKADIQNLALFTGCNIKADIWCQDSHTPFNLSADELDVLITDKQQKIEKLEKQLEKL